jgi:hypothetical protein
VWWHRLTANRETHALEMIGSIPSATLRNSSINILIGLTNKKCKLDLNISTDVLFFLCGYSPLELLILLCMYLYFDSSFWFFLSGMFVFCAYVAPFFIAFHKGASKVFFSYIMCALLYFFFTYSALEVLEYLFVNNMETVTGVNQPPTEGVDDDHPPRPWPWHQIDCSKFQGSLTKYNTNTEIIVDYFNPVLLECDSDGTTSGNASLAYRTLTFTQNTPEYGPLTVTLTIPENVTSERTLTITDNRKNTATIMLPNKSTSTSSNPITFRNKVDFTITFTDNGNRTTTVTLSVPGNGSVTSTFRELNSRHRRTFLYYFNKVYVKPVDNKPFSQEECPVDNT